MKKCSIIAALYNSNKVLAKFLLALSVQTEKDFELVLTDDGSNEDCLPLINSFQKYFINNIKYVKQERNGIRKTTALNRGVLMAETDYLLFIDPDCLASPDWVEVHLRERENGFYLIGRRIEYREKMTPYLTDKVIITGKFSRVNFFNIYHGLMYRIKHIEKILSVKNKFLRKILHYKGTDYLIGCNFSCWKDDLYKVNGWDNDFLGLGHEDVELDSRLRKSGLKPKSIKFYTNVFHIFHKGRKNDDYREYCETSAGESDYFFVKNGLKECE